LSLRCTQQGSPSTTSSPAAPCTLPPRDYDADDLRTLIKQALVVVLDVFVSAIQPERTVTYNDVMDALARCWSDHFRQAVEERKAYRLKDMTIERAKACRRDLLLAGVPFAALWNRIIVEWSRPRDPETTEPNADRNPLFYVVELGRGKQALSWDESRRGTDALAEFEAILGRDKGGYTRPQHSPRILAVGDPDDDNQPAEPRRRIAAERDYNVIHLGKKSREVIGLQERTQLVLRVGAVLRDFARASEAARQARRKARRLPVRGRRRFDPRLSDYEPFPGLRSQRELALERVLEAHRDEAKKLAAQWTKARGHVMALKRDWDRLREWQRSDTEPAIKTKFTRAVNRRWQPVHFWPLSVTPKQVTWGDERGDEQDDVITPPRAEWFRFRRTAPAGPGFTASAEYSELVSLDVSGSQSAILGLLLGLDDLEARACSTDPPFKVYLAGEARHVEAVQPTKLKGDSVGGLPDLCKELWMQVLYGSTVSRIVERQAQEAWEHRWKTGGATRFLHAIPFYERVMEFLSAARHLAKVAYARDRYEGVIFVDPFDGATVRWNPIKRRPVYLPSSGQRILVSVPVGPLASSGQYRGDAPVDLDQLRRSTAPMLVHMLDAYFSALVLQRLGDAYVPAIGIHDAWVVPRENLDDLKRAIDDAGAEWFLGLGGIYDRLITYLDAYDPAKKYAGWAHEIKRRWEARCRSLADRPIRFATKRWDPASDRG
jgi:hypothetical protein